MSRSRQKDGDAADRVYDDPKRNKVGENVTHEVQMVKHKPISAVIFDMDGLMLDTETLAREAWFATMRDFGIDLTDEVYLQVLGTTGARTRQIFTEAYGDHIPIDQMYARKQMLLDDAVMRGRVKTKPGLIELLDYLDARQIKKAVGSSTVHALVLKKLGTVGLVDRFPVIVGGDDVVRGKPAPDIFLRCAELLGVSSSVCLVLEDSDNGVRAAHAAGMCVIVVPDLKPPAKDVQALAWQIVGSLHDAIHYIHS
jgi:HAD superfamily hydrolase (TIGR01509 family)